MIVLKLKRARGEKSSGAVIFREALNLSKRKLSELAMIKRMYVTSLERGEKRPTLNVLFYLSDAFGMQPSELKPNAAGCLWAADTREQRGAAEKAPHALFPMPLVSPSSGQVFLTRFETQK